MLPIGYKKQSFLRFKTIFDVEKLRNEFDSISPDEWMSSYWGNIHCSIGMLLLRGGDKGTSEDFFSEEVFDNNLLEKMPYINHIISNDGPFGEIKYAFIFKTVPNGVTLRHQDTIEKWKEYYRVHIPIYTNPEAFLIADERSQHFAKGYAWSFDNQTDHGVVNGNMERVHLIMDVAYSEKMKNQIDEAIVFKGEKIQKHIDTISNKSKAVNSYLGDKEVIAAINTLRLRGANDANIAHFFNTKKIPTKTYPVQLWNARMIHDLVPD